MSVTGRFEPGFHFETRDRGGLRVRKARLELGLRGVPAFALRLMFVPRAMQRVLRRLELGAQPVVLGPHAIALGRELRDRAFELSALPLPFAADRIELVERGRDLVARAVELRAGRVEVGLHGGPFAPRRRQLAFEIRARIPVPARFLNLCLERAA